MESTSVGVAEPPDTSGATFEPGQAMRWLLAALSCGAGVIHLAMVPQHAQESLRAGLGFAAAGWFQIAFAIAIMARPTRTWVRLAIVGNAVFVATWVLSRTAGLPSWTGEGGVESASAIDILCVALEVGVIVAAIAVLVAPNLLKTWNTPVRFGALVFAMGIFVGTTAALAAPSTAEHVHGGDAGDSHVAGGDGHDHDAAAAADTASPGEHAHDATELGAGRRPPSRRERDRLRRASAARPRPRSTR